MSTGHEFCCFQGLCVFDFASFLYLHCAFAFYFPFFWLSAARFQITACVFELASFLKILLAVVSHLLL